MSKELKPCPFCGGEPERVPANSEDFYTGCATCDVWTDTDEIWNRRAHGTDSEPATHPGVAEVEEFARNVAAAREPAVPTVTLAFTVEEIRAAVQAVGRMSGATETQASDGEDMLIKQLCWLRANTEDTTT